MKEQIAIIGMGCIYPDAPNIYDFWNNILKGKKSKNKIATALLDSKECEFVSNEIESNEAWKAFSLIAVRQALIDAGLYERESITSVDKERIGLITSITKNQEIYKSSSSSIMNAIINKFDIKGFACELASGNSNNLACLKLAIDELKNGNASVMLAGSISTEGVGIVTLKRLIDAKRDGDKIYAVIRGVGVTSEGTTNNSYQEGKDNKKRVINKAYDRADIDSIEIGLLETSGIGKNLEDASEFCALADIFRKNTIRNTVLGSIQNEQEYLSETSSMAGLIKVALALHQKVLPPSFYEEDITEIIKDTSMCVINKAKPWLRNNNYPCRYGAISSFEQGGVNYHIVVQEDEMEHKIGERINRIPKGIMFSALTKEELIRKIGELAKGLNSNANLWREKKYNYYTNSNSKYRLAFVVKDEKEASNKCYNAIKLLSDLEEESWIIDNIIFDSRNLEKNKCCIVFGGERIDKINILSDMAINYPIVREIIKIADNVMIDNHMITISQMMYPHLLTELEKLEVEKKLNNIANIQPIMTTIQICIYEILKERGLKADYFIGHSFSELVALWADDVFDIETLIDVASIRGYYISNVLGNTSMLKVHANIEVVKNCMYKYDNIYISKENSPYQVVVAGNANEIEIFKEELQTVGIETESYSYAGAYHTPYMVQAAEAFGTYLNNKKVGIPSGRVISSYNANFYGSDIVNTLVEQIINPVLVKSCIEKAYEEGTRLFIEIGSKDSMKGLIKETLGEKEYEVINLYFDKNLNSTEELELQLAKLAVYGYGIKADMYEKNVIQNQVIKQVELNTIIKDNANVNELNEIVSKNQLVIKNNLRNIDTLHTEVFSKFMDSQNYQIKAISKMLESNKDKSEIEKKQVIDCIGKFRDNSLSAFKIYFGDKSDLEDKQNIIWSEVISDEDDMKEPSVMKAIEDKERTCDYIFEETDN